MQAGDTEPELSWRARVANKLAMVTLIALSLAVVITTLTSSASSRVSSLALHVFAPVLALLALERYVVGARDYRVRAWLTIGGLLIVGVVSTTTVGLLGGAAGALFLALTLTSLLFGLRAMVIELVFVGCAVGATAALMVSGVLAAPLEQDVSFARPNTWLRTAGTTIVLVGLAAVVIAQVVRELEQALARVKREAKERERAQEERAQALELALQSQKVEVVGRLAAGLAHDLNNALFVIGACNQTLQRGKLSEADVVATHAAIAEAVKQSSSMSRQMLSFARKHVVAPVALSTRGLFEELRRSIAQLFPSDMKVEIESGEDLIVRADKMHLQQAILNLAINARDAMTSGGQLTVRARRETLEVPLPAMSGTIPEGRYAVLEVRDTGSGMDAVTQARAFEPLFTTKPEGQGTGLGLASVRSTIEMSGGYVSLWSQPGLGTCVSLYLPLLETTQLEANGSAIIEGVLDLRGTTVLLAEDSAQVRGVITSSLAQHGCTVLQARDGTEAIDQIDRAGAPIHVLCTDAVMPGAPVRDVLERLREKHPNASVVVISGYVNDELTRRGIEQGHYRVLAKPFGTQQLLQTVADIRAGR
jgi:two-component system cell cycle sensor histidine kinase/response regulator CckA